MDRSLQKAGKYVYLTSLLLGECFTGACHSFAKVLFHAEPSKKTLNGDSMQMDFQLIGPKSSFASHCKTWLTDQAVYLYYIQCLYLGLIGMDPSPLILR